MNTFKKICTSGSSRWIGLWLAVWVAAAAFFFWRGADRRPASRSIETTRTSRSVVATNNKSLATRNIEQIRVGDRVHVDLPAHVQAEAIGRLADVPDWDCLNYQIDPSTWRKIILAMDGDSGDRFEIVLLRPLTWIQKSGVQAGGTVHLVVPEQGLDGPAGVLAVEACPDIHPGVGHVVTGTFTHVRGDILQLRVEGVTEPLGVTANHTMYSADRDAFVMASELSVGERLRHLNGLARIRRIDHVTGEQRVYNLEVHGAHVFHVTSQGVLVHNTSSTTGAFTEPSLPNRTIVREKGVTIEHYTKGNDHPPAHAHVYGEGAPTRIGANGKPLAGDPELSPAQQDVVNNNLSTIRSAINKIRAWWKYKNHLEDQ